MKKKLRMACVASFLLLNLSLSSPVISGGKNLAPGPSNMAFVQNDKKNLTLFKETEDALRKSPSFDLKQYKVVEIFTWEGASGRGFIAAVRAGAGRTAGCAIYEKSGDSDFDYVNGQPFCNFSKPSGIPYSNRSKFGIKFIGKIRQSSDSPTNPMEFDLIFDGDRGIFCDSRSSSSKYNCDRNGHGRAEGPDRGN